MEVPLLAIPFGIIGAVIGHILLGYDLSLISFMGVIALSGVVVNDALIMIDFANRKRHEHSAFDAIHMDPLTDLPVVVDDKCTACGACVDACPRDIIELRKKNKKDRKIFVSCINEEKGGVAKKNCSVACIGCSKCFKVCPFEAITMENNLAFIDSDKCKLCRKCVVECPTSAILELNFPPPRKPAKEESVEAETK